MIDIAAVLLGEGAAPDHQNILGVQLGAVRKVVRAGDHRVVHDEHLVVHEVVRAIGSVGRGLLAYQARVIDDIAHGADLPVVVRHVLPLEQHTLHLGAVVDPAHLDPIDPQQVVERRQQRAGVEQHAADADPLARLRNPLGNLVIDRRAAAGRE